MRLHRAITSDMNNPDDDIPDEAAGMLAHEAQNAGHLANGSSGHTLAEQVIFHINLIMIHLLIFFLLKARAHSSSPRRIPLFERASARWWNPQFASAILETQYWKCSFPLLRDRFRSGLIYIMLTCGLWMLYVLIFDEAALHHWVNIPKVFLFSGIFILNYFVGSSFIFNCTML